jgi:hypothetical protein
MRLNIVSKPMMTTTKDKAAWAATVVAYAFLPACGLSSGA